jgi:hypothetical protein
MGALIDPLETPWLETANQTHGVEFFYYESWEYSKLPPGEQFSPGCRSFKAKATKGIGQPSDF